MEVICCKSGKFDTCKTCEHADPHEPEDTRDTDTCTKWGNCYDYLETDKGPELFVNSKVRCVNVKGKIARMLGKEEK